MLDNTVALVGATGRTGRPLVDALLNLGARVRVLSRDPERWDILADGVELRRAELMDAASLGQAFAGATSIHYIPPSLDVRDPHYLSNIIAAADRVGVPRIVYHSVLHSNTPEMPHHLRKSECERLLRHSPIAWTILQPAMYVQTMISYFDKAGRTLSPPFDTAQPFNLIDLGDLAAAAAIIHTTAGHAYANYELAGSERLDSRAMAQQLSEICAGPVVARKANIADYVARFASARGLSEDMAHERRLMFDYYDHHGLVGNSNILRMILGREPTSFLNAARASLFGELMSIQPTASKAA